MSERKKLVLVDGHALAYRAFHALPTDLATSKGELTNAVYGFTSMLLNVLRDEKPDYIAVAFDVGKSFRHDVYEPYKAHRVKAPEEMTTQMGRLREMVRAFNIPIFEKPGFEANFNLVQDRIRNIHMHDLSDEAYPYRKLFSLLREADYPGYCDAEVGPSCEPVKFMKYYRALFLALQDVL